MKRLVACILFGAWILSFGFPAWAEHDVYGYIKLDERLSTIDPELYTWNRAELGLQVKSMLADQVIGYGELKLKSGHFPEVENNDDLTSKSSVSPLSLELYEAYIDLLGWPYAFTDIRLGKQRIAWGTADKLNPTDNLNPYDFTDFLDFGKKIPTNAIRKSVYFSGNTFQAVLLPVFVPAALPDTFDQAMQQMIGAYVPSGMTLGTVETSIALPPATLQNSMYALKLSRNILGNDMSVSYFSGFDSIPNLNTLALTAVSTTEIAASLSENYPQVQVVGFDLAGSFLGMGYWAEFANFTPLNVSTTVISPSGTTITKLLNYTKYTLGGDYTFENGFYVNSQFMHGFFDERGSALSDFLSARVEQKFFEDKLKLALTWFGELKLKGQAKVMGSILGPEVVLYPADAVELALGLYSIDGESGSKLSSFKDLDQVYLKAKYSF